MPLFSQTLVPRQRRRRLRLVPGHRTNDGSRDILGARAGIAPTRVCVPAAALSPPTRTHPTRPDGTGTPNGIRDSHRPARREDDGCCHGDVTPLRKEQCPVPAHGEADGPDRTTAVSCTPQVARRLLDRGPSVAGSATGAEPLRLLPIRCRGSFEQVRRHDVEPGCGQPVTHPSVAVRQAPSGVQEKDAGPCPFRRKRLRTKLRVSCASCSPQQTDRQRTEPRPNGKSLGSRLRGPYAEAVQPW